MKKIYSSLFLSVVVSTLSFSQQTFVNIRWDVMDGTVGAYDHVASSLDPVGNVLAIGNHKTGTNSSIFFDCIQPNGNVAWVQTCPSLPAFDDFGSDMKIDVAGNIYVCGAHHNGNNYDYFIAKYLSNGTLIWQQYFDGTGNGDDIPSAIEVDLAGNVYVTGSSTGTNSMTDFATLKYNSSGVQQWVKFYDFSNKVEVGMDIAVDFAGNVIICGASAQNPFNSDFVVRKYDASGTVLATKRHNSPGNGYDMPTEMVVDASGNIFVTGTADATGNRDIKVIAYDANLQVLWVQYSDQSGNTDESFGITTDVSGNVTIAGYCTKSSGGTDFLVAKYNGTSGNLLWKNCRTAPIDSEIAKGRKVVSDNAGNIYAFGDIQINGSREYSIMSFKPNGSLRFAKDIDVLGNDYARQMLIKDDVLYITGISDSSGVKRISTVRVEVFDKNQPIVTCGIKPCRVENELLVRFSPNDLIYSNVDNRKITFGIVNDFVKPAAVTAISDKLGFDIGRQKCYKVYPKLTSANTTSVSRNGNVVDLPTFYATFGVILPTGSNDTVVMQNLNASVPHIIVSTFNEYATLTIGANDPNYNNGNSAGLIPSVTIPDANINIEPAWDRETGDSSVVIGVFDTGINYSHTDISNGNFATSSIRGGYDYYNNAPITSTPNPDNFGHGTAVGGIIGSWRNNNFGIAGVAGGSSGSGGVTLHDMKIFHMDTSVCGAQGTPLNIIAQAIVDGALNSPIGLGQDIQNHSWTMSGAANIFVREAFNTAYENEVVLFVASGNGDLSGNPCAVASFPASFKDHIVMKVGANDSTGTKASFSECSFGLDFIAPGTHELYIGLDNNGSAFTDIIDHPNPTCVDPLLDGTSFASPHAAGVGGLMTSYSINNSLPFQFSHEDNEELMQRFTTDLTLSPNTPGYDAQTGWGRLNAGALFDSIVFPKYRVEHYSFTTTTNSAILIASQENSCLEQSLFGLPVGAIKANRWQIAVTSSHTLPNGYNLITGWPRGSASDIYGINSGGFPNCLPYTCYNCNYLPDAGNPALNSVTQTGVIMTGYIYQLLDAGLNPVGWWPYDTSSVATFAYSLYLVNPTVGIFEEDKLNFNMYPNPSNNTVTISLGSEIQGKTEIVLTDIAGKLVKVLYQNENMPSGQTITFTVDELSQGMYFVSLSNNGKNLAKKLLVSE